MEQQKKNNEHIVKDKKRTALRFFGFGLYVLLITYYLLLGLPKAADAQEDGLRLSLTPPLFQLTIDPGGTWSSSIKVLNKNSYPLTIYASPVNFHAQGDRGGARFTPIIEDEDKAPSTLAYWMDVSTDGITIPAGESIDLPFTVRVPQDAPPGGHYASILIGNRPISERIEETEEGAVIRVGSMVASLFFMRVEGDIEEKGIIREFFAENSFNQKPEVDFSLRFQNKGNVHLQPQGNITIYNMFGRERGKVPINQETKFGNVLPETERKFNFTWRGGDNLFDIGRYRAQATLAFGQDGRQSVTRAAYFWIIPVVPLAGVLGSIIAVILIAVFGIRAYVRRMLRSAHQQMGLNPSVVAEEPQKPKSKKRKFKLKINMKKLIPKKALYVVLALLLVAGLAVLGVYLKDVLTEDREFEVVVSRDGGDEIVITSEEEEEEPEEQTIELPEGFVAENYSVSVVNTTASQEEFLEAVVALERAGFDIAEVQTEASGEQIDTTIVRYSPEADEAAFILSQFFEGVMEEDEELETDIVVLVKN